MVTRLESGARKLVPYVLPVDSFGHLERDLEISTFDGEVESRLLILYKVQSDLGVSLLLEVTDDALSDQVGGPNDL